jgi:hypothetical protein
MPKSKQKLENIDIVEVDYDQEDEQENSESDSEQTEEIHKPVEKVKNVTKQNGSFHSKAPKSLKAVGLSSVPPVGVPVEQAKKVISEKRRLALEKGRAKAKENRDKKQLETYNRMKDELKKELEGLKLFDIRPETKKEIEKSLKEEQQRDTTVRNTKKALQVEKEQIEYKPPELTTAQSASIAGRGVRDEFILDYSSAHNPVQNSNYPPKRGLLLSNPEDFLRRPVRYN